MANYHGDSQHYNTQSVVYQACGTQVIKYQEIPTHGARDMTTFENKGHTYLAVANHYNQKQHTQHQQCLVQVGVEINTDVTIKDLPNQ